MPTAACGVVEKPLDRLELAIACRATGVCRRACRDDEAIRGRSSDVEAFDMVLCIECIDEKSSGKTSFGASSFNTRLLMTHDICKIIT